VVPACRDLRVSHIVKNGEHFYVLVNEGEEAFAGDISFPAGGEVSVFDPWSGREFSPGNTALSLERRGSLIVCAGKDPSQEAVLHFEEPFGTPEREIELKDWQIGSEKAELGSWTGKERLKDFCGTLCYQSGFEIDLKDGERLILDMGEVAEQAEVYLNGGYAGYRLWSPYVLDLTDQVQNGKNNLRIEVTNSLANRYGRTKLPSGLLGRVVLKVF